MSCQKTTTLTPTADRMRFAPSLRLGPPIGSSAVEATDRTLVGVHRKRSESRWKTKTALHVLRLSACTQRRLVEPGHADASRHTTMRVEVGAMINLLNARSTPASLIARCRGSRRSPKVPSGRSRRSAKPEQRGWRRSNRRANSR